MAAEYVAAKAFKIKDDTTGQIVQLKPGDDVPGELPNAARWINYGYVIPQDKKHLIMERRSKPAPNLAVDGDGKPIPPDKLARFKAERDVRKIERKHLLKKAAKAQIDVSLLRNESEVREALVDLYESQYDDMPTALVTSPGHRKGLEITEGDDADNDELYTEEHLNTLNKAPVEKIGTEDFGLQFGSRETKEEMIAKIVDAPWTVKALAKLSVTKLVEIANEDFGLEVDETKNPGELVPAIIDAQAAAGEGGGESGDEDEDQGGAEATA